MRTITRNGISFRTGGVTLASVLDFHSFFKTVDGKEIFKVTKKDFGNAEVTGVNVENNDHTVSIHFKQPVTQLQKL